MNTTISILDDTKSPYQLWLRLWFEIVAPLVIIFGILSDLLVFIVMPRKNVTVGSSAKIYYSSIAISDCIDLINSWFLYGTINDTMYELIFNLFNRSPILKN